MMLEQILASLGMMIAIAVILVSAFIAYAVIIRIVRERKRG
jgi:hypothetical protein